MAAQQAPPSLGFSRQEHWSGLPFPSPVHETEPNSACIIPRPGVCPLEPTCEPASEVFTIYLPSQVWERPCTLPVLRPSSPGEFLEVSMYLEVSLGAASGLHHIPMFSGGPGSPVKKASTSACAQGLPHGSHWDPLISSSLGTGDTRDFIESPAGRGGWSIDRYDK